MKLDIFIDEKRYEIWTKTQGSNKWELYSLDYKSTEFDADEIAYVCSKEDNQSYEVGDITIRRGFE